MVHAYEATVELPVPPEHAWEVLLAFDAYPAWNPFTPRIQGRLELGCWVRMRVDLGWITITQRERICELGPHRIAWELPGPRWLLYARRVQTVAATETGSRYTTVDTIEGMLSPIVEALFGPALRRGFAGVADGLLRAVCNANAEDHPRGST